MITDIYNYLNRCGIKPSAQRIAVMEHLMTHHDHPTADAIYNALSPQMPTLSRMTVYNTLKLLSEKGAILALNVDDKQVHYDGDTALHAHFICRQCGTIEDVMFVDSSFIEANKPRNVTVEDVQLIYKGCCKKCSESKNN